MARAEKSRDVELLMPNGRLITCRLFFPESAPWYLEFFRSGGEWKVYEGEDLFECLAALRKDLDADGIKLLCNGSRRDVFSSTSTRSLGGGDHAYRLIPGCKADKDCLVDLFDYAPPALVSTVEEQKDFFLDWLHSVNRK